MLSVKIWAPILMCPHHYLYHISLSFDFLMCKIKDKNCVSTLHHHYENEITCVEGTGMTPGLPSHHDLFLLCYSTLDSLVS